MTQRKPNNILTFTRGRSSDALLENVRVAWVLGYTYEEIADKFCSGDVAKATALVHEDLGRAQQYTFEPEVYDEWKRLYDEERWTYQEIADAYEVGVGTVRFHVARKGARIRRRGWKPKSDPQRQEVERREGRRKA